VLLGIMNFNQLFKQKIRLAFDRMDADKSGCLDRSEFRDIMHVSGVKLKETELVRIFDFIDSGGDGTIELPEFIEFLDKPIPFKDSIRCAMDASLERPAQFLKFHSWLVQSRPSNFKLRSGPKNQGAYFATSTDQKMVNYLQKGSRLISIGETRVERFSYNSILEQLKSTKLPVELIFQNPKLAKKKGTSNVISPDEYPLFDSYFFVESEEEVDELYEGWVLPPHCEHCPNESWWLHVHQFMEDEEYSTLSWYLAYCIVILIALSTVSYVLQTVPRWEEWKGWQLMEATISILFTVEFTIRILACRNMKIYMQDPMNLIDLCAVLPYWIELVSGGLLQTQAIRVVRAVRLFRLIRLTKTQAIGEIMDIYRKTLDRSIHWLLMLFWLGILTLIVFSSFANIFEKGKPTVFGECDPLTSSYICEVAEEANLLSTFNDLTSRGECALSCAAENFGGCCFFDQYNGDCRFYNSESVIESGDSDYTSGTCDIREISVRKLQTSESPFVSVSKSFWLMSETFTMVGYGEDAPTTLAGKILAAIAVNVGIFFFVALPVTVIGWHFTIVLMSVGQRKNLEKFLLMLSNDSVSQVLDRANEVLNLQLFQEEDQVVFLAAVLDTKRKLEQVLGYSITGWSYLPFCYHDIEGFPRVSQFKLFALFGIFGRIYQRKHKALKREQKKFTKSLTSFENQHRVAANNQPVNRIDPGPGPGSFSLKLLPKGIRWWNNVQDAGKRYQNRSKRRNNQSSTSLYL